MVRSRASWQRRGHACQPSEGEGTFVPRVWRCCTVVFKHTRLTRVCDKDAQPFNLVKIGWHIILNLVKKPVCKQGWDGGHKLSIKVEAQPVPQKTTKSHEITPSASRVKQRQQEGTGALQGNCQRTKKGESSGLPKNGHLTGTLEHRHQPQYQPYRIGAETRKGRYWERSIGRRRSKESCNK